MTRPPPRSTRTDTLLPYTSLVRSRRSRRIMGSLAAAVRMPDMHRALEIERGNQRRDIGGVGIHVVARVRLARSAMPSSVVGNHPVAFRQKEHQLIVPFVGGERPAVMEDERLCVARPPILVEYLHAVGGFDAFHYSFYSHGRALCRE